MDVTLNPNTQKFIQIPMSSGLQQRAVSLSHYLGHTIHLLINRDNIIFDVLLCYDLSTQCLMNIYRTSCWRMSLILLIATVLIIWKMSL